MLIQYVHYRVGGPPRTRLRIPPLRAQQHILPGAMGRLKPGITLQQWEARLQRQIGTLDATAYDFAKLGAIRDWRVATPFVKSQCEVSRGDRQIEEDEVPTPWR